MLSFSRLHAETENDLLRDTKGWAGMAHPEQKVPFSDSSNNPDGFLSMFDPPPEPRVRAGWFGGFGAAVMTPQFNGRRGSRNFQPFFPAIFPTVDSGNLDRLYGPEVLFGYRTPGWGEVSIRYQGLYGEESQTVNVLPRFAIALVNLLPAEQIIQLNSLTSARYRSRFRTHTFDAFLSTDTLSFSDRSDLKFSLGVRFATFLLEDRGDLRLLSQFARNTFEGVGPLIGIDWNRKILDYEQGYLAWLHTRFEGSYLFGDARQTVDDNINSPIALMRPRRLRVTEERSTPRLAGEVGFSFADLPTHQVRGTIGYRYDQWFGLGRVDDSDFDLVLHGVFLRVEWRY
jgi:hypothetical protein